jgi:hypothetical protein
MYLQAIVPAALLCVLLGCAAMHKPVPPPLEPGEQEHLAVAILADQTDGAAPLTVHFNSETFEREDITEFHWDLGDGSTSTNKSCKHTYTKPGDYTVTLKAVSATGFSDSDWQTITVEGPDDESDD